MTTATKVQVYEGLLIPGTSAAFISLTPGTLIIVATGTSTPLALYTTENGSGATADGLTHTSAAGDLITYIDGDAPAFDVKRVSDGFVILSGYGRHRIAAQADLATLTTAVAAKQAPLVSAGAWATATAYIPGTVFTEPSGGRRLVVTAYTSGATYGATDSAATVGLSRSSPAAGLYVPSGWGGNWKAALAAAKAGTGRAVIGVVGDSVSRGMMASDLDGTGYVALLRQAVQTYAGDGGSGFHGICDWSGNIATLYNSSSSFPNTLITSTGTWANLAPASLSAWRSGTAPANAGGYCDGPGANSVLNWASVGSAAAAGTMTAKVRGRYVSIFYGQGSGSSGTTATVDGQALSMPTSGTTGIGIATKDMGAGSESTWHTVVVTATSAGYTQPFGFAGENTLGVIVNNFSRAGFASGAFAVLNSTYGVGASWSGGPSYTTPSDLHIISLGLNDSLLGITESAFTTAIATQIETVKSSLSTAGATGNPKRGKVDVLLVMQHGGTYDTGVGFNYHAYCQRAENVAKALGCALYNQWARPMAGASWQVAKDAGYWGDQAATPVGVAGSDGGHPGTAGHAAFYADFVSCLPVLLGA